tara:strand:- start:634 stop:768 length:135 start_codon:yes stop_codon:yes gene_type:complete
VWYVPDLLIGEKSGKKIGMKLSIVQNGAPGKNIFKMSVMSFFNK